MAVNPGMNIQFTFRPTAISITILASEAKEWNLLQRGFEKVNLLFSLKRMGWTLFRGQQMKIKWQLLHYIPLYFQVDDFYVQSSISCHLFDGFLSSSAETFREISEIPYPCWEKMQLIQNYCKNFCKILQENALTLTNSCKIFARAVCFFCKIFASVVFSLDESLSQYFCYRTKRIRYLRF